MVSGIWSKFKVQNSKLTRVEGEGQRKGVQGVCGLVDEETGAATKLAKEIALADRANSLVSAAVNIAMAPWRPSSVVFPLPSHQQNGTIKISRFKPKGLNE